MPWGLKFILTPNGTSFMLFQHKFSTFMAPVCRKKPFIPRQEQRQTIVDKRTLVLSDKYPEPWPYKEKGFHENYVYLDWTQTRLHQNSKLIVVEGNIASGKSEFAKKLADELGFYYMPAFSMDDILIDRYGNDLRKFYHLFPKRFRVPDEFSFYENPADDNTAVMQDRIYLSRWEQYLNAQAHIFNTGQGVVLERSVFGDFTFVNAMRTKDWISSEYFKWYYFIRKMSIPQLRLWPHLFIYLHCPVQKCLENIRKRGNPHEIAAVDAKYLSVIEESYKDLIKEARRYSFIHSYDWTEPEHIDTVLDNIYKENMDTHEWHSGEVTEAWHDIGYDIHYGLWRSYITQKKDLLELTFGDFEELSMELSELYIYPPDGMHFKNVMKQEVLKSRYSYGYQKRDPITLDILTEVDMDRLVAEKWYEYMYKDMYFDMYMGPERMFDPFDKDYNPDYMHHH